MPGSAVAISKEDQLFVFRSFDQLHVSIRLFCLILGSINPDQMHDSDNFEAQSFSVLQATEVRSIAESFVEP